MQLSPVKAHWRRENADATAAAKHTAALLHHGAGEAPVLPAVV